MDDLISRQDIITLPVMPKEHRKYQTYNLDDAYEQGWFDLQKCIEELPSAQPEIEERMSETEQNVLNDDFISRKGAIDAVETKIKKWNAVDGEGYHVGLGLRYMDVINTLAELPSAQPEPYVDTIDALNESIKHFDDLAEECRRNANIERNDYMDMRDDAAEYRQLSIWLNELKWLRERFQSQSEQKWIPVSKKLPKEDTPVLVTDDAGGMATVGIDSCGRYEDTGERFWYTSQNVTAWMYTVEPYGGEQDG